MEFGRVKNFVDGEWTESEAKEVWPIRNPALDIVIGEVPMSTDSEVDAAVRSAMQPAFTPPTGVGPGNSSTKCRQETSVST